MPPLALLRWLPLLALLLLTGCATRESCVFRGTLAGPGGAEQRGNWDLLQHRGFDRADGRRQLSLVLPPLNATLHLAFAAPAPGRSASPAGSALQAWIEEPSPAGARAYIGNAPPRLVPLQGNASLAYRNDYQFTLSADLRGDGTRDYRVKGTLRAYAGPDALVSAGALGATLFNLGSPLLLGSLLAL